MMFLRSLVIWLTCFCVIWWPSLAYAQAANVAKVVLGSNGGKVIPTMYTYLRDIGASELLLSAVAGGGVNVGQGLKAPVGPVTAPMTVSSTVPGLGVAKALARALPYIGAASTAYAIFDYIRCRPHPVTGTTIMNCDPGTAPVSTPMYKASFSGTDQYNASALGLYMMYLDAQRASMCASYGANCLGSGVDSGAAVCSTSPTCTGGKTWVRRATGPSTSTVEWANHTLSPSLTTQNLCPAYTRDAVNYPIGEPTGADGKCRTGHDEETAVDIAAARVAPTARFASDSLAAVREAAGKKIDLEPYAGPATLTGPASVSGPAKTTTTTSPTGTPQTVTETTTYPITYAGDTYNYTTNTTTVNNTTGETKTETKTEDVSPPSDPAMPGQPKLYEQKYPDGLVGVWNNASAALHATPIFTFLGSLVPSIGDGGCPTWTLPIMTGWKVFSSADISVPCWVWSALRGVFVCTALLTSRRIIFGG